MTRIQRIIALLVALGMATLFAGTTGADTHTWNGGGGDASWTNGANWDIGVPVANDLLHFGGTVQPTSTNDFPAGTQFNELRFKSTADADFELSGNSINLGGNFYVIDNGAGTFTQTINNDLVLVGANRQLSPAGDETLVVNGVVSDGVETNDVVKLGTGTLKLTTNNTYDQLRLKAGTVQLTTGGAAGQGDRNDQYGDGDDDVTVEFVGGSDVTLLPVYWVGDPDTAGLNDTGGVVFRSSLTGGAKAVVSGNLAADADPLYERTVTLAGDSTAENEVSGVLRNNNNAPISLVKTNGGKWLLSGSNTYTGTTDVVEGTLQFEKSGSLYGADQSKWTKSYITVRSNATLAVKTWTTFGWGPDDIGTVVSNLSLSGAGGFRDGCFFGFDTREGDYTYWKSRPTITDTADGGVVGVRKLGANLLRLEDDHTYTGDTLVEEGTLQFGVGFGPGEFAGDAVVSAGATLRFNKTDNTTIGGVISGGGQLVVTNVAANDKLILTANNTYTGGTTVAVGTLQIGANGTSGDVAGNIVLSASTSAVVFARSTDGYEYDGVISGEGSVRQSGNGLTEADPQQFDSEILELSGNNSYSGGTTIDTETRLLVSHSNALGTGSVILGGQDAGLLLADGIMLTNDVVVTNQAVRNHIALEAGASSAEISGSITLDNDEIWDLHLLPTNGQTLTLSGDISDLSGGTYSGNFIHNAAGTTILTGNNTFSGLVQVQAGGTLLVNGDSSGATNQMTVASGASVGGTGTWGGDVLYQSGADVAWPLGDDVSQDGLDVLGDLQFNASVDVALSFTNGVVDWTDTFWSQSRTWTLFDVSGTLSGYPANLSLATENWQDSLLQSFNTARPSSSFELQQSGEDVQLVYTIASSDATWQGTVNNGWSTNANWSVSAPGSGNTATFDGAGNGNTNINLGGGVTVSNIYFESGSVAAYTIGTGGAGAQALTIEKAIWMAAGAGSDQTIDANVTLANNAEFRNNIAGKVLTVNGDVTASAKQLTLYGFDNGGAINLAGTGNDWGGETVIAGATVTANSASAGNMNIEYGTLTLNADQTLAGIDFGHATLGNGDGTLNIGTGNTNALSSGVTYTADDTSANTATIAGGTLEMAGGIQNVEFNIADHASVSGPELTVSSTIKTNGTNRVLVKSGAGTLKLTSGASVYTQLRVHEGTVQLTDGGAVGTTWSDVYGDTGDGTLEFVGGADITVAQSYKAGNPDNFGGAETMTGGAVFKSSLTNGARALITHNLATDSDPTVARTLTLRGTSTAINQISGKIQNHNALGGYVNVAKQDAGKWLLSGNNTYTGTTTVAAGNLQFAKPASLYNDTPASWTAGNISVESAATLSFKVGGVGFDSSDLDALLAMGSASGGFKNGAIAGIDTSNGDFTYATVIADPNGGANALSLTKLGANTLSLDANATYTGNTLVEEGTLRVGTNGTSGDVAVGVSVATNAVLEFARGDSGYEYDSVITGEGSVQQAGNGAVEPGSFDSEILELSGNSSYSGGTTIDRETRLLASHNNALGTGPVTLDGQDAGLILADGITLPNNIIVDNTDVRNHISLASGATSAEIAGDFLLDNNDIWDLHLMPTNGQTLTLSGDISDLSGGTYSGNFIHNGAGTTILTGNNSFSGEVRVQNSGTLLINGNSSGATSSLHIVGGASLGGSGNYGGSIVYTNNADVVWRLMDDLLQDGLDIAGNLLLDGNNDVELVFNAAGSGVDWTDAFWTQDRTWTLFDVAGTTTGYGNLTLVTENWQDSLAQSFNAELSGAGFALQQNGQDVELKFTAVVPGGTLFRFR
jgi:fibronectin-binding autotransporter adhesin